MSFGNNVVYYRKKLKITQEALADMLYVSRQTVSRWETDSTFPDVDMLIRLCELFDTDMDTLVRGDAESMDKSSENEENTVPEQEEVLPTPGFERHEAETSRFAISIALGTVLIIFGVALLLFTGFISELLGVTLLLLFITAAVAIYIVSGLRHSAMKSEFPSHPIYPKETVDSFLKKTPFLYAGAISLILLGVIAMILALSLGPNTDDLYGSVVMGIFLTIIALAVGTLIYTGIRHSGYTGEDDDENERMNDKGKRINEVISSVIMLLATILFLLGGFLYGLWHPGWIVFPIGGCISGIVASIISAVYPKEK